MKKILVLDTDGQFRAFLRQILSGEYEVIEAQQSREAFQLSFAKTPDLLILNSDLLGVCIQFRKHPVLQSIPILMILGVDEATTLMEASIKRAHCLDSGADDVLDRAFSIPELLAKVRASLRAGAPKTSTERPLFLGNLEVCTVSLNVEVQGQRICLTPTERDLLRYFVERPSRAIARKQLLLDLWPDTIVTRRTIDTHIASLRKKLVDFDHEFQTVFGSGYRLSPRGAYSASGA